MNSTPRPILLVIGDSISIQYGEYLRAYLADRFTYRTKQEAGDALANLDVPQGANGGDSQKVLDYLRLLKAHNGLSADLMLLNCGLHDLRTDLKTRTLQVPLDQYERNLREIVALIHEAGVPLVWVRTTESVDAVHNTPERGFHRYATDNQAYTAAADAVMTAAGVPIIDLRSFTRSLGSDEQLYCDHVHFHQPIRQLQAAFLAGWVHAYTEAGVKQAATAG